MRRVKVVLIPAASLVGRCRGHRPNWDNRSNYKISVAPSSRVLVETPPPLKSQGCRRYGIRSGKRSEIARTETVRLLYADIREYTGLFDLFEVFPER